MKYKGHGIVWDKSKDKVLCEFENGFIETEDKAIIETLNKLGYEPVHDVPAEPEPEGTPEPKKTVKRKKAGK